MDTVKVHKITEDLKKMVEIKRELIAKRDSISESIKNGRSYFGSRLSNGSAKELNGGANRMYTLVGEYEEVTKQINDTDLIMISMIESYSGNFNVNVRMPHKINDAGDVIESINASVGGYHECDYIEITPDDIWFLKMVKAAYRPTNVSVFERGK